MATFLAEAYPKTDLRTVFQYEKDGINSKVLTSWHDDVEKDPCPGDQAMATYQDKWKGIRCENTRITEMFMSPSPKLQGPIDLEKLPAMDKMYFPGHEVNGSFIATDLPTGMKIITIFNNKFSGKLDLTNLPASMEEISAQYNMFDQFRMESVNTPSELKNFRIVNLGMTINSKKNKFACGMRFPKSLETHKDDFPKLKSFYALPRGKKAGQVRVTPELKLPDDFPSATNLKNEFFKESPAENGDDCDRDVDGQGSSSSAARIAASASAAVALLALAVL